MIVHPHQQAVLDQLGYRARNESEHSTVVNDDAALSRIWEEIVDGDQDRDLRLGGNLVYDDPVHPSEPQLMERDNVSYGTYQGAQERERHQAAWMRAMLAQSMDRMNQAFFRDGNRGEASPTGTYRSLSRESFDQWMPPGGESRERITFIEDAACPEGQVYVLCDRAGNRTGQAIIHPSTARSLRDGDPIQRGDPSLLPQALRDRIIAPAVEVEEPVEVERRLRRIRL